MREERTLKITDPKSLYLRPFGVFFYLTRLVKQSCLLYNDSHQTFCDMDRLFRPIQFLKERNTVMKKNLKRWIAMLLCLCLAVSAFGCTAKEAPAGESSSETQKEETITETSEESQTESEGSQEESVSESQNTEEQTLPIDTSYTIDYEPAQASLENYIGTGALSQMETADVIASDEVFDPEGIDTDSIFATEPALAGQEDDATGQGKPGISDGTSEEGVRQLTIEDIQAMNPDSLVIDIYSEDGFLSTLVGKYYEGKVTNFEEGVQSLQGIAALLGLSKGSDFFAVYEGKNNTGYHFYTYQQRYGGYTLQYATLRVIVDPDGYVAGVSSSFVPNIGTAPQTDAITQQQAEQIVADRFARFNLTIYPEYTIRLAVPYYGTVQNCWVVYTNNPENTESFDMPYIQHFVTTAGDYLMLLPADSFAQGNQNVIDNSGYFEGLEVQEYKTTVTLADGSKRDVDVPVSYNARDRKYYLIDPSRKIAVAQYGDFNYRNTVTFVSSDTIDGWSENNLMAYANYIICYDFYADHGIKSIDGFEMPILVTVGWCDENGEPVNNACFYGMLKGWACFGISDINNCCDAVDVIGHEYTHGVVAASAQYLYTINETGFSEAYADIMGNLIEMSTGYTDDRTWIMGERTGEMVRNMSTPLVCEQPEYVGDLYYMPVILNPNSSINDFGGQHINNSLLGHIAYLLDQAGMSYEQQFTVWLNAIEVMHSRENYEDLHAALLLSLKINGLLEEFGPALNQAFRAVGLDQDWNVSYLSATREGCGRVTAYMGTDFAQLAALIFFLDASSGQVVARAYPDPDGVVSALAPVGTYVARAVIAGDDGYSYFNYTSDGWYTDGQYKAFSVTEGQTTVIYPIEESTGGNKLNFFRGNGGYFTMMIPDGWQFEFSGQYASFGFKIWDPEDPSTQIFFYGGMAPFHKSEETRAFWEIYDPTYTISKGPILPDLSILGVLATWDYCIEYQKFFGTNQFTPLAFNKVLGLYSFDGNYAEYGAVETGAYLQVSTEYDADCRMTVVGSLLDEDIYGMYGGNSYYTCRDFCAIVAPADRYDEVFEDLLTCLTSLEFTGAYILQSQSSYDPMVTQDVISAREQNLANIMIEIYSLHKGQ